jgi:uncharacterized protein YegJ (DUF2314 family)
VESGRLVATYHQNQICSRISFIFVGLALTLCAACSKRDKVINVAGDDPEMKAAIAKARDTLPQFWQAFNNRTRGETDFSLKVRITDNGGVEHFWLSHLEKRDAQLYGVINNDAEIVRNVKLGERLPIPEADISDWLYMREGKMVGNYTLRVLFKSMPAAEVRRYKEMLADP